MSEVQAIASDPTAGDWDLQPADLVLMEQLDKLNAAMAIPGLPDDLVLRLLDHAWHLLEDPRHDPPAADGMTGR